MPDMTLGVTPHIRTTKGSGDNPHSKADNLAPRVVAALLALGIVLSLIPALRVFARQDRFGTDWIVQSTITAAGAINFVRFIDQNDGFIASDNGTLSVTHDGGITWHIVTTASQDSLTDIAFTDPRHGFVVGGNTLLTTTDGGQTWHQVVSSSLPSGIVSITVASANTYFVTDGSGDVYATSDYGATWNQLPDLSGVTELGFSTPTTGWATEGTNGLLHSTDDGYTWSPISVGLNEYDGVAFVDANNGYVLGVPPASSGEGSPLTAARTTDGGTTWSLIAVPGTHVYVASPTRLMAWSETDNVLYESSDAGVSWQKETLPASNDGTSYGISPVIFAGYRGQIPYAVQSNGAFLHYGPVPTAPPPPLPTATTAPPTETAVPSATAAPSATATSTVTAAVPAPSGTLLHADRISPKVVTAGSRAGLIVTGTGFDNQATISIGVTDITNAVFDGRNNLTFAVPDTLKPGVYDVTVTEPDGSSSTLPRALTVRPFPRLAIRLLHQAVAQGATGVLLIQAPSNAQITVHPTTMTGKVVAHLGVRVAYSSRGGWRVLLLVGKSVAPGKYLAQIAARLDSQVVKVSERFLVVKAPS